MRLSASPCWLMQLLFLSELLTIADTACAIEQRALRAPPDLTSYPGDYEETLIRSFNHRRCLRRGSPAGCDRLRRGATTGRPCTVSCCSRLQRSVGPSATDVAS